jgi:hypothetical protein
MPADAAKALSRRPAKSSGTTFLIMAFLPPVREVIRRQGAGTALGGSLSPGSLTPFEGESFSPRKEIL